MLLRIAEGLEVQLRGRALALVCTSTPKKKITEHLDDKHGRKQSNAQEEDDKIQSQQHQCANNVNSASHICKHSNRRISIIGLIISLSRLEIANDVWEVALLKAISYGQTNMAQVQCLEEVRKIVTHLLPQKTTFIYPKPIPSKGVFKS